LTSKPSIVDIEHLSLSYRSRQSSHSALSAVSLNLKQGEALGLVGESGSGKSTLAHAIINLLPPQAHIESGKVRLFQQEGFKKRLFQGRDIAMIFQDPMSSLTPHLTIAAQMLEPMIHVKGMSLSQATQRALSLLGDVNIHQPEQVLKKYPHELSGGMCQRIMIAIALSAEPLLLIADEPTTALDVTTQATILHILKDLQLKHNMALLFVSHDLGVIHQVCDRVCVMHKGQIVEQGSTKDILKNPKQPYTKSLIASIPRLTGPKLDYLPSQELFNTPPHSKNPDAAPLLSVEQLCVSYSTPSLFGAKKFKTLNELSFNMVEGEILGIVGESGSGKSTLAKALCGLIPTDSGKVTYRSAPLKGIHPDLQMVFQDPSSSLNPRMTIGGNIAEALKYRQSLSSQDRRARCNQLLEQVNLPPEFYHRYPHELSGGQKQRVGIARALADSPKLLICDEPVSALDVSIQAQVLNLLKHLQRSLNISMIFITHDISVVRFIADRLIVMTQGSIVEIGATEQLLTNPQHDYTKSLLNSVPDINF